MRAGVLYHHFPGAWQEGGIEAGMSNVVAMAREKAKAPVRTKMQVAGATKYYQTKSGAVHAL